MAFRKKDEETTLYKEEAVGAGDYPKYTSGGDDVEDAAEYLDEIYDIVDAGVLVAYPLGNLMAAVLPTRRLFGTFTLNPGKFSHKEHALIYVFCNSGAATAYAIYNVIGQRYKLGQNLTLFNSIVFVLVTQVFGYGLAGLCRRYLVRPPAMLWPSNLSIIAMLNSLHDKPSSSDETYTMSRFSFFWLVTGCAFCYQWCKLPLFLPLKSSALTQWIAVPLYIMPILSAVSVLCYISPQGSTSRFLGSAQPNGGVGLLSLSFDWNIISVMAPITSPLWAVMNQMFGLWLFLWIVVPILYFTNAFGDDMMIGTNPDQGPNGTASEFPFGRTLNSPALFDKDGSALSTRAFIHTGNLSLNEAYYNSVKPVHLTTYFAISYTTSFLVFTAAIVHVALWYGKDIWHRFRTAMEDLDSNDIHAKLMNAYPDVPDLWYLILLGVNLAVAIAICQFGGFDLPWWGVILGFILAAITILPIGIIQAISGQQLGLNVMSEFLIGLILPGRMAAVMAFKTLSFMAMAQGLALVSDLKLGHYMKIPPRAMFIVQLLSTIVASIVNVLTGCLIYESFGRSKTKRFVEDDPSTAFVWKLDDNPPVGWSANGYNVFLNAGAIWGAIGPARFFGPGSPYFMTLIGFLVGLVAPVIPFLLHRAFPNGSWNLVNVPLIAVLSLEPGSLVSSLITPLLIAFGVNYFLKRYRHEWWRKYAYVMSAGFDSGLTFALAFVFFLFQYNAQYQIPFPAWAGNTPDQEHCAPEFYLTCMSNAIQGGAKNQTSGLSSSNNIINSNRQNITRHTSSNFGVFFRKYTHAKAVELKLVGWVTNNPDGSVAGVAQGAPAAIEKFKTWISTVGSPKSRIDTYHIETLIVDKALTTFTIRK
ncbi:hypothetical protein HK101_007492 [Irineochytrium annulatum]|nr:hypothetical protein HK101_007492 [Irineochytrium annulatum]